MRGARGPVTPVMTPTGAPASTSLPLRSKSHSVLGVTQVALTGAAAGRERQRNISSVGRRAERHRGHCLADVKAGNQASADQGKRGIRAGGRALGRGRPSSVVTTRSEPRPRSKGSAAAAPIWCMARPGTSATVVARLGEGRRGCGRRVVQAGHGIAEHHHRVEPHGLVNWRAGWSVPAAQ